MDTRKWLVVTVAAAVLAMVILAWLLYLRPANPARLAERYIQQNLALLPAKMGSADSLVTGVNLYNSGKFAKALQQYEGILRLDSLNPVALNYAGIVSLRIENYDKALDYFIKLEHHTDPRVNPALFYEALTLLKRNHTGDSDHAKQLLRQIVENEWSRRADAQELLGKL
jgi:tetratricopeptide (TPR) repeat protein